MGTKITEGQMDFLGLLAEYDDSQGAKVKVREPGRTRTSYKSATNGKLTVKDVEPEQLSFDFTGSQERTAVKTVETKSAEPETVKPQAVDTKPVETKPVETKPVETKPVETKTAEAKPIKEEPVAKEPVESKPSENKELLFKQCKKCWCFDCRHNSRNEGVPREMCGTKMPCPACQSCIGEDQATICEIGNPQEGCKLRALEEGIISDEPYEA